MPNAGIPETINPDPGRDPPAAAVRAAVEPEVAERLVEQQRLWELAITRP